MWGLELRFKDTSEIGQINLSVLGDIERVEEAFDVLLAESSPDSRIQSEKKLLSLFARYATIRISFDRREYLVYLRSRHWLWWHSSRF